MCVYLCVHLSVLSVHLRKWVCVFVNIDLNLCNYVCVTLYMYAYLCIFCVLVYICLYIYVYCLYISVYMPVYLCVLSVYQCIYACISVCIVCVIVYICVMVMMSPLYITEIGRQPAQLQVWWDSWHTTTIYRHTVAYLVLLYTTIININWSSMYLFGLNASQD